MNSRNHKLNLLHFLLKHIEKYMKERYTQNGTAAMNTFKADCAKYNRNVKVKVVILDVNKKSCVFVLKIETRVTLLNQSLPMI